MSDGFTLLDYNVQHETYIDLALVSDGGGIVSPAAEVVATPTLAATGDNSIQSLWIAGAVLLLGAVLLRVRRRA
jgi:LPXTG-motif cell wall-anchored protein